MLPQCEYVFLILKIQVCSKKAIITHISTFNSSLLIKILVFLLLVLFFTNVYTVKT